MLHRVKNCKGDTSCADDSTMSVDCVSSDGSVSSDKSFLPDETDTAICDPVQEAESDNASNFPTEEFEDERITKHLCSDDVIEYKQTKSKHSNQRASIALVDDSHFTQRILLNNNIVLSGKRHDVRRVKLFDTEARSHMPNPVAEWHNLKGYMLQPGVFECDLTHNKDEM